MITTAWSDLAQHVGDDLGWSRPQVIDQAMVDAHAATTGDAQWIHNDPERARAESPFGVAVVQGFLLLSLLTAHGAALRLPDAGPVSMLVNYGFDRVRFVAPVPVGASVRAHGTVAEVRPKDDEHAVVAVDVTVQAQVDEQDPFDAVVTRWCFLLVKS